ncbi:MAG: hypothetical protein AVDCRST_MAG95-1477 [uncultured Adhaeribacter sp.]|uniref:Uncharacterized protein n=1 Tax=uncultured Adhaeribacter sp. TaxID=448109 RepID=A0A6J4I503_9BACT|nr:MAG: hypothetical protein AVDCRST_MAG95-1477 [uncultured Adhaeribacter sp.]
MQQHIACLSGGIFYLFAFKLAFFRPILSKLRQPEFTFHFYY